MTKNKQILLSLLAFCLIGITAASLTLNTDFLKGGLIVDDDTPAQGEVTLPSQSVITVVTPRNETINNFDLANEFVPLVLQSDRQEFIPIEPIGGFIETYYPSTGSLLLEGVLCYYNIGADTVFGEGLDSPAPLLPATQRRIPGTTIDPTRMAITIRTSDLVGNSTIHINCVTTSTNFGTHYLFNTTVDSQRIQDDYVINYTLSDSTGSDDDDDDDDGPTPVEIPVVSTPPSQLIRTAIYVPSLIRQPEHPRLAIQPTATEDLPQTMDVDNPVVITASNSFNSSGQITVELIHNNTSSLQAFYTAPVTDEEIRIEWDGRTCGNYTRERVKTATTICPPGFYSVLTTSRYLTDEGVVATHEETADFQVTDQPRSSTFEPEITIRIPDTINQRRIRKADAIGATDGIPSNMYGTVSFGYERNFNSLSDLIFIRKDGVVKALFTAMPPVDSTLEEFTSGEAFAPRNVIINWDAQTCGIYNEGMRKTGNVICEPGVYEFFILSGYIDPSNGARSRIQKTQTFIIIDEAITPRDTTAPVVTISSPSNGSTITTVSQTPGSERSVLTVRTNENSKCFLSQTPDFTNFSTINSSDQRNHSASINITEGSNAWYVKCTDDINATIGYSEPPTISHTGNMSNVVSTRFKVRIGTPPPSDNGVSCDLTYNISNNQNDKFDPDTEKVTIEYTADDESSALDIRVRVLGPLDLTADDLFAGLDNEIDLTTTSISNADLPYTNQVEWDGKGTDDAILEDGIYVLKIEARDDDASNDKTGENYDCDEIRPLQVEHTGGAGNNPIMQIKTKKIQVPFGEEQFVSFRNNVEAAKVVINLYRTDSSTPVSTAYYYCGPGESCPETHSTNMSVNTRSIAVPFKYFSDPAKYYFKASLKTKSGKIYKVKSNKFEPESGTILLPQCNFSDVNPSDPRYGDILRVCELGIMTGSPDPYTPNRRVYRPFDPINRIEGITLANNLALCPSFRTDPQSISRIFRDMLGYEGNFNAQWMFDEINKGINCLALTGYADETIRPTQLLNNAEAWKIVLEAIQTTGLARFNPINADIRKEPWWSDYEYFLRQNALSMPNPTVEITRGEIASFIGELERRGLVEFFEPLR